MSDDDEPAFTPDPPAWRRAVLAAYLAIGPLLRLGVALWALWWIWIGGESIHAGAGYLGAGGLVWLELSLARRRGGSVDAE